MPRETDEEVNFGDFSIFSDPKQCYSIFNFKYPSKQFDRLSQLMEFNVLNNISEIKENIQHVISRRKRNIIPQEGTSFLLKDPPKKDVSDEQ